MEPTPNQISKKPSQQIDFYKIFKVFLSRWYWILACVIAALAIAKIKILYTTPVYITSASLKLEDANPSLSSTAQLSAQAYNYTDKIQAESYVIKSNDVLANAIGNLAYQVSYYINGRIKNVELYPNIPFKIDIITQDSMNFSRTLYHIKAVNEHQFKLKNDDDFKSTFNTYRYGEVISQGNMQFKIVSAVPAKGNYSFRFNGKGDLIGRILNGLNVSEAARFTNVMSLTMTDENSVFAADALNAVMKEYIAYDIFDKRKSARQTVQFIDTQLGFINNEAGKSGNTLAEYKTKNNIVDINSTSAMVIGKLSDFEKQKSILKIEALGIQQLENQLQKNSKVNIDLDLESEMGGLLSGFVTQLNTLLFTREVKLNQFNATSSPIKDLDNQIIAVKQAITNNIKALKEKNQQTLNYIDSQINLVNQHINKIPVTEQNLVSLSSNFEVNNKVRSYLSEKKLDAEMNAAAVVPGASIVNLAYPSNQTITTDAEKIYTYALLLGGTLGIALILLVRFLNPNIYDKETVEALTRTPIIGVIRKFPEAIDSDSKQALSLSRPKSIFAESVRSVRTNLSFLASHKDSKTICITSEISGEGKSFVTINLASTLALIDKKVILIAADLRKSKLYKAFDVDNQKGLSTYLANQCELNEITYTNKAHGIDFISSGPVPPNPSELLHSKKMKDLLEMLVTKYDYVLLDTAPIGLVSDAIPLIRQSDINLFVIRSGKSNVRSASIPERLSREYNLNNLAIVLNAFGDDALHANYYTTDYARGGGNSTYYYSDYSGYNGAGYYDEETRKWWQWWQRK